MERGILRLLAVVILFGSAAEAVGEHSRVVTKDGKTYVGDVEKVSGGVVIDRNNIKLKLKSSEIAEIVPLGKLRDEYEQRVGKLKADDVQGHYALAQWCQDNGLTDLVIAECQTILKAKPDHGQAKLLMRVAKRALGKTKKTDKPERPDKPGRQPAKPTAADSPAGEIRLISEEDVQRIRFAEIVLPDPERDDEIKPDKVPIQFANNVLRRFYEDVEGSEGFQSPRDRTRFFKMKAIDQLGAIVRASGRKYQPDIKIKNDPRVFMEFKTRVWPIINSGCATSGCHSGPEAAGFRLFYGVPRSPEHLYTNFMILDLVRCKDGRILDRDRVEESLLLHYGLPAGMTKKPHPGKIKPVFRNQKDMKYKTFEDWLYLLVREPNYGVKVPGMEVQDEPAEEEEEKAEDEG